jgi:DNA-binding transcriptional regulator YiaG
MVPYDAKFRNAKRRCIRTSSRPDVCARLSVILMAHHDRVILRIFASDRTVSHMPNPINPRRSDAARHPLDHDPARVRARRKELGLTLSQVGAKAAVSVGHLSEIERGVRNPSPVALARIATALRCRLSDLMPTVAA